ncbi:MAG TPA: DivIVA domain-containing protein [Candidatus Gemmiger avicola]|uniref:DivIVA domain-containing protein n=1 Tax=Candidatus Gemmiger avicola TaxID=2838605 RepID=A0A9D2M4R4_9FIRM|nr:DivIVA domain-containing protein [Candidatus Gemmiger avicola]
MIASEDVRRVTFERAMRGYRCEDVDDYLKQVADSMDTLSAENDDLQKKLVVLAQRIDQYRAEEDTLRTTMINAQRLGENVIKEAKQKAAEIIRAATIRAEDREQHARDEVELAKQELITLRKEADNFKKTLIGMYREHIEVISKIPEYHGEEDDEAKPAMQEEAPAPAPVQEPEPQPAPEPQPVSQPEPEQEPEVEYADPGYYEEPAPAAPGGRVRTVEFAIAPKDDEPAPAPAEELPDASALFAQPAAAETPKKATRRSTTKKTTRKTKAKPQEEPLPGAFDSFEGVDYND